MDVNAAKLINGSCDLDLLPRNCLFEQRSHEDLLLHTRTSAVPIEHSSLRWRKDLESSLTINLYVYLDQHSHSLGCIHRSSVESASILMLAIPRPARSVLWLAAVRYHFPVALRLIHAGYKLLTFIFSGRIIRAFFKTCKVFGTRVGGVQAENYLYWVA